MAVRTVSKGAILSMSQALLATEAPEAIGHSGLHLANGPALRAVDRQAPSQMDPEAHRKVRVAYTRVPLMRELAPGLKLRRQILASGSRALSMTGLSLETQASGAEALSLMGPRPAWPSAGPTSPPRLAALLLPFASDV